MRANLEKTLLVLLALATLGSPARAERWTIAPGEAQQVGFHSKAPLESFDGTTNRVSGVVDLDAASVPDSLLIEVRVDMASLDTGIKMRNRHMRENHLHTDRFPESTFRGTRVTSGAGADLSDGAVHEVTVEGELEIHGVKKVRSVTLQLTLQPGDGEGGAPSLRIEADFPVTLSDHDVPRPRFLFAKLGEVQRVFVDVTATR